MAKGNPMSVFPKYDPDFAATYAEEAAMVDASEALAELLEQSGMTRTELAKALSVSKGEITERLRGERNITVRKLAATMFALGHRLVIASSPIEKQHSIDPYADWKKKFAAASARRADPDSVPVSLKSNLYHLHRTERAS
ncbi:helix-turn-helix domain-containing protein [Curtobacterium oceanosedimentum]|uniref:helix-turn-helix domain-containing protein n=1 Tax=Curtobacterium oceanosedimentum TaxID=465820 RepID=UPI003391EEF1